MRIMIDVLFSCEQGMWLGMCVRNKLLVKFLRGHSTKLVVKNIDDNAMRKSMKKIFLLLLFIPFSLNAESIPVKDSLASLIESAVVETNFDVNISIETKDTIEIDKINGIGVCDPAAKNYVLKLQKAIISNIRTKRVFSMYGAYIRDSTNGKVRYLNTSSPKFSKIIKGCINLYVRVE